MSRLATVIFDLDGTLLDTLVDIANAANDVLTELGEPTHSYDRYRVMVGDGVATLFKRALPRCESDENLHRHCIESFERTYLVRWNQHSGPYPGIRELLDWLSLNQIPMAVLSNKPHAFTVRCVEHLLSDWKFDVVLGASDRFPKKPDPASAIYVAQQLGAEPASTVYVGDTNTDMWTANGAGCFAVGVTWGFRTKQELIDTGAKSMIDHPMQLCELFAR